MSILAQCGYGRGDKIEQGLDDGAIHGVIMSPRDERRERLEQDIKSWRSRYPSALVMFDPQFYAANLNNPRNGHLSEYDYYNKNSGLRRTHFSGTRIQGYVRECLDYQQETFGSNLAYLLSPTILFDAFRDSWSQIALNMAVESADCHANLDTPQPLLISLVISETAFQAMDPLEEFLDALTEIDAQGFYIIIRSNSASVQNAMESAPFGRFMYFCHVLTTINEYNVIVGYSDWHSFLLETAGVTHTATGWYQNLHQFSLTRFQPSSGGRRPRKRYSSAPLLSSPLINPELQDIYLARLLPRVLSGSARDTSLKNGPAAGEANWTDEISCLAHWHSLNDLSQRLSALPTQPERIQEAERLMQNALTLYAHLGSQGVSFDPSTGPDHIREWQYSLQEFRGLAGL
ncbi:MAG TPA: hypothetical protein VGB22_02740 [candidate division Zixibacteria bacterium]|jgi:hypothetical protein